jgi:hypothetical protein
MKHVPMPQIFITASRPIRLQTLTGGQYRSDQLSKKGELDND